MKEGADMKDTDILVCALGNASYCAATYNFIDDCEAAPAPSEYRR